MRSRLAAILSLLVMSLSLVIPVDASVSRAKMNLSGNRIATTARQVAAKTDTIGWCYAAVKSALQPLGVLLTGGAAWMAQSQLQSDHRFKTVSAKYLQKGDILVHGKSNTHPWGHIAVYLGNNREASDHIQALIQGGTYGQTTIFRAKTDEDKSTRTKKSPPVTNTEKIAVAHPSLPVTRPFTSWISEELARQPAISPEMQNKIAEDLKKCQQIIDGPKTGTAVAPTQPIIVESVSVDKSEATN